MASDFYPSIAALIPHRFTCGQRQTQHGFIHFQVHSVNSRGDEYLLGYLRKFKAPIGYGVLQLILYVLTVT